MLKKSNQSKFTPHVNEPTFKTKSSVTTDKVQVHPWISVDVEILCKPCHPAKLKKENSQTGVCKTSSITELISDQNPCIIVAATLKNHIYVHRDN